MRPRRPVLGLVAGAALAAIGLAAGATAVSAPSPAPAACQGVRLQRGQADIDAHAAGTSFCLSGVHAWSLVPRTGDTFTGPAILDGAGTLPFAFSGGAPGVTLDDLTIEHYAAPSQRGPVHPWPRARGWTLRRLDIGFNANAGLNGADGMQVLGGRIHDNGQEGIGTGMVEDMLVDAVEVDHNDTHDVDCSFEAGGIKLVGVGTTIRDSRVHDNHCKGIWTDVNASRTVLTGNDVYDNDAEGILVEISTDTTVVANAVWGNGFHTSRQGGCPGLWGGGITLASSSVAEVRGNRVEGNCNGITGVQQRRPDGVPGLLQDLSVRDNAVSGRGISGATADNGADLDTRHISFVGDSFADGQTFCATSC